MERRNQDPNPLYTVTNYLLFFGFVIALCVIDFNVLRFLDLQVKRLELAVEKFFFRLKLEYDIFMIKRNKDKYLKIAKEILADIEKKNEQV